MEYIEGGSGHIMGPGFGGGMMGYGWIFQILVFVIFVLVIYWIMKNGKLKTSNDTPKEILQKRLAKGEITKKEYKELLKEIEG